MSSRLEHTITSLLAARTNPDAAQLTEVYERAAPALLSWIVLNLRGRLGARIDAEEVAQETWMRAMRQLGDFDPARASFRAWLVGIARNVLLEAFQTLQRQPANAGSTTGFGALANCPDTVTSVTRRVAREDALQHFIARVGEMSEDERVLVLSCGLEGLSTVQAATRLGISADAALKRWQRLRVALGNSELPRSLRDAFED